MIFQITRIIVQLYFNIYHRVKIYGRENLPVKRPVILAPIHASYLDPPVVGLAFYPERLCFIAWDALFKVPLFASYLRTMGTVPVSHENKNSSAGLLRMVMGQIKEGRNVFVCPEGHRTTDGNVQPLEGGVTVLSLKTGTPVVPVWVSGTYRALAPHMRFPRPRKITVTFGEAIDPAAFPAEMDDKAKRAYILETIEKFYLKMQEEDRKKYPLKEKK